MPLSHERKEQYFASMRVLLDQYSKVLLVNADNVRSQQMAAIRRALRGTGNLLMGKKTMMRKVITMYAADNAGTFWTKLAPHIVGNVGLLFINDDVDPNKIREVLASNKVPAPARAGSVAPVDVYVEPGPTGCDPGQTGWFQAMNVATKVVKGQIEIIDRMRVIEAGAKVTESAAALLAKLNVMPFSFALQVVGVFDKGAFYTPEVLDLTDAAIMGKFGNAVSTLAAISLGAHYPTKAALPHLLNHAYKQLLSLTLATEFTFPRAEAIKKAIANAPAAPAAAAAPAAGKKEEKKVEKKEEKEEEEEEGGGGMGGLFGDDE